MSGRNLRKAISQAKYTESSWGVVSLEIALISLFIGLYFKSIAIGGLMFIAMVFGLRNPKLNLVYAFLMSAAWGFAALVFASKFTDIWGQLVIALIFFLIGLGVHFSAGEYSEDMSDYD